MAVEDLLWLEMDRREQSTVVDGAVLFGEQVDVGRWTTARASAPAPTDS